MSIPRGLALALALFLLTSAVPNVARADVSCTLVVDASNGATVHEDGACDARVTPASTFKLALAVIAFDAGLLTSAAEPVYANEQGDPDWGGATWTRDTTPRDWMRYSVVWYSQRITRVLGEDALAKALRAVDFGNADVSGGVAQAWLGSSLQISAREQTAFLRRLVTDALPVAPSAMRAAQDILPAQFVNGWRIQGKTGGAFEGNIATGWFVGWASKGWRVVVFARMHQGPRQAKVSPGRALREAFVLDWPRLLARQP